MRRKNGFMMYELVISFALAFAILLVIFSTSISLNRKLSTLYVKNKVSTKQIILNKEFGTRFNSDKVSGVALNNNTCTITYEDGDTVTIEYSNTDNNKYVKINNEKISFDDEALIEDFASCTNNHIKLPIKYVDDKIDYGIDLYNFIG